MSSLEQSLFDVIKGETNPTEIFGRLLSDHETQVVLTGFEKMCSMATERISEIFKVSISCAPSGIETLEFIIQQMWEEGWSPEVGNISLFANDFGTLLTDIIRQTLGGRLVFRDKENMVHTSVYWEKTLIEAFPYHKCIKRLQEKEGESLTYFYRSLSTFQAMG